MKRHSCEATIRIKESVGRSSDRRQVRFSIILNTEFAPKLDREPTPKKAAAWERKLVAAELRQVLGSLGHPVRLKLLCKLLSGPAVYQSLKWATRLAAGPLYHHINQLRIAGLIRPKERNLYELTRAGRNLIMIVAAGAATLKDARPRISFDE